MVNLLNELEPMQEQFNKEGFEPFRQEYLNHWMHTEQQVTLKENGKNLPVRISGT